MEFPKMLYKVVGLNSYGQLEAEQNTTVQDAAEEAQARKDGWHDFEAKAAEDQAAEQPKPTKTAKTGKAAKAAEDQAKE